MALLDVELPGMSGLEAAELLRDQLPSCRVVVVTTFGRPGYLQRAMAAGALGFLVKDGPVEELADAVRRVVAGEVVVDPALAGQALRAAPSPLTTREREVLVAAEDGATVADIAARLHLSTSTVRNYLSDAIGKTGARNRTEAAVRAAATAGSRPQPASFVAEGVRRRPGSGWPGRPTARRTRRASRSRPGARG